MENTTNNFQQSQAINNLPQEPVKKPSKLKKVFKIIGLSIIVLIVLFFVLLWLFNPIGDGFIKTQQRFNMLSVSDNSFTTEIAERVFTSELAEEAKKYEGGLYIGTMPTDKGRVFFFQGETGYGEAGLSVGIYPTQKTYQFSNPRSSIDSGLAVYNANGEEIKEDGCWSGWIRPTKFCNYLSEQKRNYNESNNEAEIDLVKSVWREYLNGLGYKENTYVPQPKEELPWGFQ